MRPLPALLLPFLALGAPSCSSPPAEKPVDPIPPSLSEEPEPAPPDLQIVREFLAQGELLQALNSLDDLRGKHKEDAKYWFLLGTTNLDFLGVRLAQGESDGLLIQSLLEDANRSFDLALQLAPEMWAALVGKAQALRLAGDFEGAWAAASAARFAAGEDGLQPQDQLECGRAGLALTIEHIQANQGSPAAAVEATAMLRTAADAGLNEATIALADLQAWQGLPEEAAATLKDALSEDPQFPLALDRLKNVRSGSTAALARDLEWVRSRRPSDGLVLWHLGDARWQEQIAARQAGDFLAAYEALDRAEECFLQARQFRPDFAKSCADWLHLVRTARGWALWEEGRPGDAAQAYHAALKSNPARLETDPSPFSLRLGIESYLGHCFSNRKFAEARTFLRRVLTLHESDAMWWNNLGLACRDIFEPAVRRGLRSIEEEEVLAMFEESWEAYARAALLAPEDPNILNDGALIAVYYFDPDGPRMAQAEKLLARAIAAGEARLQTLQPAEEPEVWRRTDMAVGDAWENFAYLEVMRREITEGEAEEHMARSAKHWPFGRRDGLPPIRKRLQELRANQKTQP